MENSDTERNQTFSVKHQTVFHMNPKPNGDFTEPLTKNVKYGFKE